jgi:hypothetical protein
MQAIITKYLGPSNVKGSRIKATAVAGSVTVPYQHELNNEDAHAYAALAYARKQGWKGELIAGSIEPGGGYVFVFTDSSKPYKI